MLKFKLLIISIFIFCAAKSQTCVAVSCSHTLPYTQLTDTIVSQVSGFTPTAYIWTITSGSGTITNQGAPNLIITGLKAGSATNVNLTVMGGNGSITTNTTITVNPAPPIPCPVLISKVVTTDSVFYSNGTIIVNKRVTQ